MRAGIIEIMSRKQYLEILLSLPLLVFFNMVWISIGRRKVKSKNQHLTSIFCRFLSGLPFRCFIYRNKVILKSNKVKVLERKYCVTLCGCSCLYGDKQETAITKNVHPSISFPLRVEYHTKDLGTCNPMLVREAERYVRV